MSNIDEEDTTAVDQDKDNVLFRKLRKLINLIDKLRDCGVQKLHSITTYCFFRYSKQWKIFCP